MQERVKKMSQCKSQAQKQQSKKINWATILENAHVRDAYQRFADGQSLKSIEREFRNTEHAGDFRTITRTHKADKARTLARKALSRRESV